MSNQKEKTTAQAAGMNRAKPYQLVLFPMNNGATNVYYILTGEKVLLRSIIYADYASHRVTLHCKKDETITLRVPFQEIEQLLCHYSYFYSPCKGIIVNFYEVCGQSGTVFSMSDGSLIPISRRKSADVLCAYSSFCFDKIRKEMS